LCYRKNFRARDSAVRHTLCLGCSGELPTHQAVARRSIGFAISACVLITFRYDNTLI